MDPQYAHKNHSFSLTYLFSVAWEASVVEILSVVPTLSACYSWPSRQEVIAINVGHFYSSRMIRS